MVQRVDAGACCDDCGEPMEDETATVEAFEVFGRILCDSCAEARFVHGEETAQ